MLRFYAERLPAVEINNTFYRMPSPSTLAAWIDQVPVGFRFVLKAPRRITHLAELRHPSWRDPDALALLRERNVALCLSDTDEAPLLDAELPATASWGYLRLRRSAYSEADLIRWVERLQAQPWQEAFVFFKHELEGPALAAQLAALQAPRRREQRRGG